MFQAWKAVYLLMLCSGLYLLMMLALSSALDRSAFLGPNNLHNVPHARRTEGHSEQRVFGFDAAPQRHRNTALDGTRPEGQGATPLCSPAAFQLVERVASEFSPRRASRLTSCRCSRPTGAMVRRGGGGASQGREKVNPPLPSLSAPARSQLLPSID